MRPHFFIGQIQHLPTHALGATLVLTCVLGGYLFGLKPWLDSEQRLRQTSLDNQELHSNAAVVESRILKITGDIETKRAELAQLHSIPTVPHQPLIELRQLERPARVKALTLTPTDATGAACSAKLSVGFAAASDGRQPGDGEA